MRAAWLVLAGMAVGCAAATATTYSAGRPARAASPVRQYCEGTGDFNNVAKVDAVVKEAGREGWELVGVYRPAEGVVREDYVCFRRD